MEGGRFTIIFLSSWPLIWEILELQLYGKETPLYPQQISEYSLPPPWPKARALSGGHHFSFSSPSRGSLISHTPGIIEPQWDQGVSASPVTLFPCLKFLTLSFDSHNLSVHSSYCQQLWWLQYLPEGVTKHVDSQFPDLLVSKSLPFGVQPLSATVFTLTSYFTNTLNYLASISHEWRP